MWPLGVPPGRSARRSFKTKMVHAVGPKDAGPELEVWRMIGCGLETASCRLFCTYGTQLSLISLFFNNFCLVLQKQGGGYPTTVFARHITRPLQGDCPC